MFHNIKRKKVGGRKPKVRTFHARAEKNDGKSTLFLHGELSQRVLHVLITTLLIAD